MKHFVVGYSDPSRKGAVTVLYAGDSRAEAREALFAGGEGIALTDYICNPQISQTRRHRGQTAEARWAPVVTTPATAPEKPAPKAKTEKPKPLALPAKTSSPSDMVENES